MMDLRKKRVVGRMLRERYEGARNIRFEGDPFDAYAGVTCTVDRMPNTMQGGRIFAGWGEDLHREAVMRNYDPHHPQF